MVEASAGSAKGAGGLGRYASSVALAARVDLIRFVVNGVVGKADGAVEVGIAVERVADADVAGEDGLVVEGVDAQQPRR